MHLSIYLTVYLSPSLGQFFLLLSFSFSVKTNRNDDVLPARHEHLINHLAAPEEKNQRSEKEGREKAVIVAGNWMLYGIAVAIISANCFPLPGNYRLGAIGTRSFWDDFETERCETVYVGYDQGFVLSNRLLQLRPKRESRAVLRR